MKDKIVKLTVRLDGELAQRLHLLAAKENRTLALCVKNVLENLPNLPKLSPTETNCRQTVSEMATFVPVVVPPAVSIGNRVLKSGYPDCPTGFKECPISPDQWVRIGSIEDSDNLA